ncbi:MAG: transcription antitermination factor NusB [Planctomycetaceae bacterium]
MRSPSDEKSGSNDRSPPNESVPQFSNARELALFALEQYRTGGEFAVRILDENLARSELPASERRLVTELVAGIVRRRLTLETVIQSQVSRPRERIEETLWTLLQLGSYQLLFLDAIPPHAAVHETVELAKRIGSRRWCGFLNGVLRSIARVVTGKTGDQPAPDAVPLRDGEYRRLNAALFADPADHPAEYFAQAFSFPPWLAERWLPRFDFAELCRLGFWFNESHGLTLRVNPLRANRDDVLHGLHQLEVDAAAGTHPYAIWSKRSCNVSRLPGFAEGQFTPQDESAMQVGDWLAPRPGETILDLCAAPGTKTTHLAELMGNEGRIVAADVKATRLRRVAENAARLGLGIIETQLIPAGAEARLLQKAGLLGSAFDAVLVDVPCSNTGVMELTRLQLRVLSSAVDVVKPGGRLLYSTCSMEPEENEGVVAEILGKRRDLELIRQRTALPGKPADGGFLALFRRLA